MQLYEVVQLDNNLWAVNEVEKTIMYFINGKDRVLLIDTGLDLTPLKEVIYKYCGDKKIIVVNTHSHIDHNGGNHQFEEVYVGRYDEPYSHLQPNDIQKQEDIQMFFEDNEYTRNFDFTNWNPGPSKIVYPLKEPDIIDIGGYTFEVIEVPSHTVGSIALLEAQYGWLFTGDIMLTWEVWGQLGCGDMAPSSSLSVYYDSLKKLQRRSSEISCIFPSHGKKEGNPRGCTEYTLPPSVIDVYCENIARILNGEIEGEPYIHPTRGGKIVLFEIGGIIYKNI